MPALPAMDKDLDRVRDELAAVRQRLDALETALAQYRMAWAVLRWIAWVAATIATLVVGWYASWKSR